MAATGNAQAETFKEVKSILVSQPKPERSPYYELEKRYDLQIDWRPFIHVEGVEGKDFRKTRIKPEDYSAVILTSRNAIDHYFRILEELRLKPNPDTKYFCMSEAVANFLQKYIVYRKRKVFVGKRTIKDLVPALNKHKGNERFLLPCSNLGSKDVSTFLEDNEFDWQDAMMYQTVSSDLSDLSDVKYDVLVFFSPLGIKSLYENFPDFTQDETRIAVFGKSTSDAVLERGLKINIKAPAPGIRSMTMALEQYLQESNGLGNE